MPRGIYKRTKKAKRNKALEKDLDKAIKAYEAPDFGGITKPVNGFTNLMEANDWVAYQDKLISDLRDQKAMLNKELEIASKTIATAEDHERRLERVIDALTAR